VDVELDPSQPQPVAEAVGELLQAPAAPDPWWQAGIDEALDT
jgi:hypothetical protein